MRKKRFYKDGGDVNSASDTWVRKTGMSWDKAKELGYTDGSAADNIKLLGELNDSRFNKKNLRTSVEVKDPANRNKLYNMPPEKRNVSYGCVNCKKEDMKYITDRFPKGDTTIVVDSNNEKDMKFLKKVGVKKKRFEEGGEIRYMENGGNWYDNNSTYFQSNMQNQDGIEIQDLTENNTSTNPELMFDPETQQRMNQNRAVNSMTNIYGDDNYDENGNAINTENYNPYNNYNDGKVQFFNPYGGVDIPTAAVTLGQSIEEDNALGVVGSSLKLATGLGRNIMGGIGMQRRNDQVMKDYYQRQKNDLNKTYVGENGGLIDFEDGGEVEMEKILTGEFMTGMDENNPIQQPNAEIEVGEHVKKPDGSVQEVLGDSHEDGGEPVNLEKDTKILSDNLKIGVSLARTLKKEHDLDIKASDTYATALDKYNKKIGLSKIVEEEEDFIEKLKEQEEVGDENTAEINKTFILDKLNQINQDKEPLNKQKSDMFETLFTKQEESKPKDKSEKSIFEDGGMIKEMADKYGVPYERASEIIKQFKDGGKQDNPRLKDYYNQIKGLGYNGKLEIGEMQKWMVENHPNEVVKYFTESGQPMTAKGVDIIKKKYPEAFKQAGINPSKQSAQYTQEEKAKLQSIVGDKIDNSFWLEQFNDNKFDWRFPTLSLITPTNRGDGNTGIQTSMPMKNVPVLGQNNPDVISENNNDDDDDDVNFDNSKLDFLMLPNQNPMLPNSLQPHLKVNRRYDRINPATISAEQNIQELNRNQKAYFDQISNIPGAQNSAALLGLSANTGENINKVISETNKINSQIISSADAKNVSIQAAEENAAAQDALSYEQRQLRAVGLTDNDINNYFNKIQENNTRNYEKVNELNLLNAMYNDFQFTGSTVEKTSPNIQFNSNMQVPSEEEKKKKTYKKGGRFK